MLQGWERESPLDSYAPERRPVAQRTIGAADAQEAFLAPPFAAAYLDDDGPAGPDSPVVVPDGGARPEPQVVDYTPSAHPGARLPHAWLPDGTSLYDLLGDGFAVLRLTEDADAGAVLDVVTGWRLAAGATAG